MTPEEQIVKYIFIIDNIIVALIPWLKWLAVVIFTALVAWLDCWDVKRTR